MRYRWAISVVSHGHGSGVTRVLCDIHAQLANVPHQLILTLNVAEDEAFLAMLPAEVQGHLKVIRNRRPQGFGANHNAALRQTDADYVAVADPDLALPSPVFADLERVLLSEVHGIAAPLALSPNGSPEDNARGLPTPWALIGRRAGGRQRDRNRYTSGGTHTVDWVAGLFMALRSGTFRDLGGFDERYFLYCEDVDLCLRARVMGWRIALLSDLRIVHAARRRTLRDLRHLRWHVASLLRLWRSPAYQRAARGG